MLISQRYFFFISIVFSFITFASCTVVRNYPVNTPYVYETNVKVEGNTDKHSAKELELQLEQQIHDSLQVQTVSSLILWQVLNNPPAYDSIYAGESMLYMRTLLNSLGYYRDSIQYKTKIDTVRKDELRTTVNFTVIPGKITTLDSISYHLMSDSVKSVKQQIELDNLQKITDSSLTKTLVKKGDAFSKNIIAAERDRLADVYRNSGYLRYSQEEMLVLWDTVGIAWLRPTLDPIEQARQLAELRRRRENPTADIEFRLRDNPDSTRIMRYYIGNITVYPDLRVDTSLYRRRVEMIDGKTFVSYLDLFKNEKLSEYIFLERGDLYRQS